MEKIPIPTLPDMRQIFDDISDPTVITQEYPEKLSLNDVQLNDAYSCFVNLKKLEVAFDKQAELKCNLEEFHERLTTSIGKLKSLTKE